ncbi:hypothetical protein BO86DRAFT_400980 [Aspergillus japonicus CBS 114.51]|uniref:Zn(2)-C6 fungal-type domain-containing protein n=1 Tax=Aspergillus japonicus CBS 114.51 TaxID=1448312 RepID=A0A8T8WXR5_ASPJA|nr:hypothetical protein BO86DRAFT_400980 [Aspergillus japonicus CBS 114.51]RAH80430.1 hypothetical protein BO86DRAFT_400980 [Aspergillus japonicus CBS 114.51]
MYHYNPSTRMKLSLRCDKEDPECKRCLDSGLACSYPQRRKPRTTRSSELHHLGHRLEALEERMGGTETPHPRTTPPTPPPTQTNRHTEAESRDIPTESSETRSSTWIYRMVSGAKDNIEHLTSEASSSWTRSTVDNAITRLDTALVNLAAPSPRPDHNVRDEPINRLPVSDIKRFIDVFLEVILPNLSIFDSFATLVDSEFLRAIPHVIGSPYAMIEPVMQVIYFNAIYFGQTAGTGAEQRAAAKTYYRCLQVVPKWLASAQGSHLDLIAASLTAWMGINNFDYHLSWQFHREACRFGDLLGIHDVDSLPTGTAQEETEKDVKRRMHWYLVEMDLLFRTWYDKPTALGCPIGQVRLPAEISPQTKQPKPHNCILFLVWSRTLFIMANFFNQVESSTASDHLGSTADTCCMELEELVSDWDLLSLARSPNLGRVKSWLFLETVIALHLFIIFINRKVSSAEQIVHPQAVRSARLIISIILEKSESPISPWGKQDDFQTHFLTFYPFGAFFTLYYHILSSTQPDEYENDLRTLERVVNMMAAAAVIRPDFAPIADAVSALNDVCRAFHSGQKKPAFTISYADMPPDNPLLLLPNEQEAGSSTAADLPPLEALQNLASIMPLQTEEALDDAFGIPFQLQPQVAPSTQSGLVTETETVQTMAQPLDFVRAVENELTWRNWHESWWNSQAPGPS